MERIKLSKREKRVLRTLREHGIDAISEFDIPSLGVLEGLGLVKTARVVGGDVEGARLTNMGKEYMADNPSLRNPVDWSVVSAIAAIASAVIATVALLIACTMIG